MINLVLGEASFEPLIAILVILFFVGFIALGAYMSHKRTEEIRKWAQSKGFRFFSSRNSSVRTQYSNFSCLQSGSNRYAYNIVTGDVNDHSLHAFDYHYETYSTDSKGRRQTHHHYFSAVVIHTGLPLRPLFIRPEGFFDKITEFFGHNDIDFESTEFSQKFYVRSPDQKWAFDVIHQETMEFLLSAPEFSMEFAGPHIIAYRGSTFDLIDFENAIKVIEGIVCRLPEYLLREMKEQTQCLNSTTENPWK